MPKSLNPHHSRNVVAGPTTVPPLPRGPTQIPPEYQMRTMALRQPNDGSGFAGPVFVVGLPRSGTKLFLALLNNHSQVAIPTTESNCIPHFYSNRGRYGTLEVPRNFDRFYRDFERTSFFRRVNKKERLIDKESWCSHVRDWSFAGVIEGFYRTYAGHFHKNIWGDKTPSYLVQVPLLKSLFPSAKFIHIIRDVRDQSLSIHKVYMKNIYASAQRWLDGIVRFHEDAKKYAPLDFMDVHYEKLVDQPDGTMRSVCNFLGIPYEGQLAELNDRLETISGVGTVHSSIVRNNYGKWRLELTERAVEKVEKICGQLLSELGYSTTYNGKPSRPGAFETALYAVSDAMNLLAFEVKSYGLREGLRSSVQLRRKGWYYREEPAPQRVGHLRIAAFGFRFIPFRHGCAGADKFAMEFYPRLVRQGHEVVAYTREYGNFESVSSYEGVTLVGIKTLSRSGFDTFLHSFKATLHIITHNTGDIVHIINGGNSLWAGILRLAGKKTYVSQDGLDWQRKKWPWYGRWFLRLSQFLCALFPCDVIFDNVHSKEWFEKRYGRRCKFIPHGGEVRSFDEDRQLSERLHLTKHGYFLFLGRLIPDKGVHYLLRAFEMVRTEKKLVIVGGSPNDGTYEEQLRATTDERVVFTGFVYADAEKYTLVQNAFCSVHPSDIEGTSHTLLDALALNTPVICSAIEENLFVVGNNALTFEKGKVDDLQRSIEYALHHPAELRAMAARAREHIEGTYRWDDVVERYLKIFSQS